MNIMGKTACTALALGTLAGCAGSSSPLGENERYLFVGTYTDQGSEGIYLYAFDTVQGRSRLLGSAACPNPSYLALSPDGKVLYAVSEQPDGSAALHAFAFDAATGTLSPLNARPTGGASPCYVSVDPAGRFAATANYGGGSITIFALEADGRLGERSKTIGFSGSGADRERQASPHLHCVAFTPDGAYLLANDLGCDRIYRFDITGSEQTLFIADAPSAHFEVRSGSGPRHIVFSADGRFAYLINELSGALTVFAYEQGMLRALQYAANDTTPGSGGKGSGDVHLSPDGAFLYASNRLRDDGIAIWRIDRNEGVIERVGYRPTGAHPRNFLITPGGEWILVACRDEDRIELYRRDSCTGQLAGQADLSVGVSRPVCLKML